MDVADWFFKSKIDEIYDRQLRSGFFRKEVLEALARTSVLVPGCGALGAATSMILVRLGVRKLRIVDHDFSQPSNYPRTISLSFYDSIAGVPKVLWCKRMLEHLNPRVNVEAVFTEISPFNIEELLEGIDIVVDGLDNLHARRIVAYHSYKMGIPYIYSGVYDVFYQIIPSIPGVTPCVSCLLPEEKRRRQPIPVLAPTVMTAASNATMMALKVLAGEKPREMIVGDVYTPSVEKIELGEPTACECEEPASQRQIVFTRDGRVKFYPSRISYIDTGKAKKICTKIEGCTNTVVSDWFFRIYANGCMVTVYVDGRMEALAPCDWLLRSLRRILRLK